MEFAQKYMDQLLFVFTAALIFIPLEAILPKHKEQRQLRAHLKTDIAYVIAGYVFFMIFATVFIFIMITLLGPVIPQALKTGIAVLPLWLQVILLIVFGDLYYYWVHRAFHTFPVLWRFHAIHHSIEDMDWMAAHRVHPIDVALTNSGVIILIISFGFAPEAAALFAMQSAWHSYLKHSNVNISWGPLRWLYVTPAFHHWHHGNQPDAYDKNFSGQFPIWDIVFGTAIMTEDKNPLRYGVDDPVPDEFIDQLFYPFKPESSSGDIDASTTTGA